MTDEQIVALYWARSEQAIAETERAYGRYLHCIAYGILRDDEDAKEITNDTYLKAWNTMPPERPSPLRAFLGRITRQLSINRLERSTAQKRGGGQYVLALEELTECVGGGEDGETLTDAIALRETLERFLRALPPDARRVFIRRYWHMSSITEIAGELAMSESKVRSMLKRTRDRLREQLVKEGWMNER